MGTFVELNNFEISQRLIHIKTTIHYGGPNYKEMLDELRNHHELTHEKIAYLLSMSGASTVSEWARGGRPNFEVGESFIELWKSLTGKQNSEIPRISHWRV